MFRKHKTSTRRLMNLKSIDGDFLAGYNNHNLIYYSIVPFNLSVLSNENVEAKIFLLMNLIKGVDIVEILCLNGRENFRSNKEFLIRRINEEVNPSIKSLLQKDLEHIDEIQLSSATARSFLICVRIRHEMNREAETYIKRVEKNFAQLGFTSQRLGKEELKTLLAVYYEQNVTTDTFEDIDGERWLLNEEV